MVGNELFQNRARQFLSQDSRKKGETKKLLSIESLFFKCQISTTYIEYGTCFFFKQENLAVEQRIKKETEERKPINQGY